MDASGINQLANTVGGTRQPLAEPATAIGQAEVQRRLVQGEMRMLQAFDSLDRDHRGYGTTNSLLAVLESMAFMPGRKSVVFFSEGLPASPALQTQLQSRDRIGQPRQHHRLCRRRQRSARAERHVRDAA